MTNPDRLRWPDLPDELRAEIEHVLGAPVTAWENQVGGFGPAMAARCRLGDGRRVFLKVVSSNQSDVALAMTRAEAEVCARLPATIPAPRLLHRIDRAYGDGSSVDPGGDWIALVFQEVDGTMPTLPWEADDLRLVVAGVEAFRRAGDPSPIPDLPPLAERFGELFNGYRTLAAGPLDPRLDPWTVAHLDELATREPGWAEATTGTALVHGDVRDDNLLIGRDGRLWFVDWTMPAIGAGWYDLVVMLPAVAVRGGPEPEEVWASTTTSRDADPEAVTSLVLAAAGYFTQRALLPPPEGAPTVRAFQAAQGEVTRRWLARRLNGSAARPGAASFARS